MLVRLVWCAVLSTAPPIGGTRLVTAPDASRDVASGPSSLPAEDQAVPSSVEGGVRRAPPDTPDTAAEGDTGLKIEDAAWILGTLAVGLLIAFWGYHFYASAVGLLGFIIGGYVAGAIAYWMFGPVMAVLASLVGGIIGFVTILRVHNLVIFGLGATTAGLLAVAVMMMLKVEPAPAAYVLPFAVGGADRRHSGGAPSGLADTAGLRIRRGRARRARGRNPHGTRGRRPYQGC